MDSPAIPNAKASALSSVASAPASTQAPAATSSPPSRWSLRLRAAAWRALQYAGMTLHFTPSPRPPAPAFSRKVQSTLAQQPGSFNLQVYVPADYSDSSADDGRRWPCVVNFHGGGFVLGSATDDARFAAAIVDATCAVFVSVDYRMAPEYPFPTPVDDCADALRYIVAHARDLRIDPRRIATSGFSAGGNLCLTSLLRWEQDRAADAADPNDATAPRVVAAVSWYPVLDFARTRANRRASCPRPDLTLPDTLTTLFDASYMHPPPDVRNPLLSPVHASDDQLSTALPPHICIVTCEWDMLQAEGADFAARLARPPLAKDVFFKMVPGVPHAWDKSPDPRRLPVGAEALYQECCKWLKGIFEAPEEEQTAV